MQSDRQRRARFVMPSTRQEEFLSFRSRPSSSFSTAARAPNATSSCRPEAERLVQSFSPETLFYTVKEIGSADSGDLLSLAVPEQIQGCLTWIAGLAIVQSGSDARWTTSLTEAGRKRMTEGLRGSTWR